MKFFVGAYLLVAAVAWGDSITPAAFSTTLAVGGSVTIGKSVLITQTSTAPLDLFFLTDTTGSMGGSIANVRNGFASIVSAVSGVASNVNYAAGQYKDVVDAFAYRLDQDLTSNTAAVQTAINSWSAIGGGDLAEANLFALDQAANTTSWRPGSQRLLVWTGDAPGHDPSNGVTEAIATNDLIAKDVQVISISANSGPGINSTGQAARISSATGGAFLGNFSPSNLVSAILGAITTSVATYSTVDLAPVGLPAGIGVSFTPASYPGSFDRSIDRTFAFDVTFTGLAPGTYDFAIAARVDGRTVATESDRILVGSATVPEPSSWLLGITMVALIGGGLRRRVLKSAANA